MPPPLPIRFVVHNLAQTEAALRAGAEAGAPVIVESPPNAGRYWGAPYFLAMISAARAAVPDAVFDAILDCGDAPGLAVEALRQGVHAVRLDVRPDVAASVADIAQQLGARVETESLPPDTLNLNTVRDPLEAARARMARR